MSDELKPCPFCGGEASRVYTDDHPKGERKVHIECDICNAKSDWQFARIASADNWWNQRHKSRNAVPPSTEDARQWKSEQSGVFVSSELDDYVAKTDVGLRNGSSCPFRVFRREGGVSELIQIWSNRDQRFIEARPCPMPPTWRDWLKHFASLHQLSGCPSRCLIYQRRRYEGFLWWIAQKPEPAKGRTV